MTSNQFPYNEQELLRRLAKGEEAAFKEFHDLFFDDLYHVALSFLKSPDWAMDIIQEVFLKIWTKRAGLNEVENIRSYLFIITRNEVLTAIQSKMRMDKRNEKYGQSLPDDFLLPDRITELKELEALVERAVAGLPQQQQLMYRLTRERGMTHEEVAAELGVAKKTVSNTLTTALNTIRLYLREHGGEEALAWLILLGFPFNKF